MPTIYTDVLTTPGVYPWARPPDVASLTITVQGANGGESAWNNDPTWDPGGNSFPSGTPDTRARAWTATYGSGVGTAADFAITIYVGARGTDGTDLWTGGDGGAFDGSDAVDGDPGANPLSDANYYKGGGGGGGGSSYIVREYIPTGTLLTIQSAKGANGGLPGSSTAGSGIGGGSTSGSPAFDPGDLTAVGGNGVVTVTYETDYPQVYPPDDVYHAGFTIGRIVFGTRGPGF